LCAIGVDVAVLADVATIGVVAAARVRVELLAAIGVFAAGSKSILLPVVVSEVFSRTSVAAGLKAISAAITITVTASKALLESGLKTLAVAIAIAILENGERPHPLLVATAGVAPIAALKIVGIVFARFVLAFAQAILITVLISVLVSLLGIASTVIIIGERKATYDQGHRDQRSCQLHALHHFLSHHNFLPPGFLRSTAGPAPV
jgi:hypothetical protein